MTSSKTERARRAAMQAMGSALALFSYPSFGQSWPSRPIKLVVPFPPGGATDLTARLVAATLSERLGQAVLVENMAGSSGTIGAAQVAKASPDGYTLLMLATPTLLASHLRPMLDYDLFKDFATIGTTDELPLVIVVNPRVLPEVKSLPDLIARAKAGNVRLRFTSPGTASFGRLGAVVLQDLAGFSMTHVPYLGSAPAVTDLLAGQVSAMFCDLVVVQRHIASGALRAIAVGSRQPIKALPGVKTVAEQGFPGFEATPWAGLLAPVRTPREVVARLSAELRIALATPSLQAGLEAIGALAIYQTPSQMSARMRRDVDRWRKVVVDRLSNTAR